MPPITRRADSNLRHGRATGARADVCIVMDARLAAPAVEHGCRLATADRDFSRFPGLRAANPLAGE